MNPALQSGLMLAAVILIALALSTLKPSGPGNAAAHQNALLPTMNKADYKEGRIDWGLLDKTTEAEADDPAYPAALEALDGKEIEMYGFMAPYDDFDSMERFMLINFFNGCQFCSVPRLQEVVYAECAASQKPWPYIDGPIRVRGVLRLKRAERLKENKLLWASFIYSLSEAVAEPMD